MSTNEQLFKQGDTVLDEGWYVNRGPRGGQVHFSPLRLFKKGDIFPEPERETYTWVRRPYDRHPYDTDEDKQVKPLQAYRGYVRSLLSDRYDYIILAESHAEAQRQLENDHVQGSYLKLYVEPKPFIKDVRAGAVIAQ